MKVCVTALDDAMARQRTDQGGDRNWATERERERERDLHALCVQMMDPHALYVQIHLVCHPSHIERLGSIRFHAHHPCVTYTIYYMFRQKKYAHTIDIYT
jgi:hypothetical protein